MASKLFKLRGNKFPIGKEFESFTDDLGCSNAGTGYLFDCAWFDALLAGAVFGVVLMVSQLASERMKIYKKLDVNERFDWVASVSNWLLSIVSTVGSVYILAVNDWYLDHPADATHNVHAYDVHLNFFIPWMIGYNLGRIFHVILGLVRALHDINIWDTLPHIFHIILYGVILDQKKFGMIAVFQMLLQSHHLYTVPQTIMEYTKRTRNVCYKSMGWIAYIGTAFKFIVLAFAGPYCFAVMWYHWALIKKYSFFTQTTYAIVIGLNTLLFTGDIAFCVYWVYCQLRGQDATKWYKDFLNKQKREKRRLRKAGYKFMKQRELNDDEYVASESESEDGSEEDVVLGHTVNTTKAQLQTELTQRKK